MNLPCKASSYARLTALCTAVYFISYISRINLSAVMVEMVHSGFAAKHTVALALTICSVTYGAGQVLSGWLGDRWKPQNVILMGFLLTAAINLSVSALQDARYLAVFWAINGLAQACMWPPLLAIMTRHFSQEEYSRACVWVTWGSAFGTIAIYAGAPFVIRLLNFRWVFAISGSAALVIAVIFKLLYERWFSHTESVPIQILRTNTSETTVRADRSVYLLMGVLMLSIVVQGALRDGVTNWMPTFVSESFRLDSSSAILTGVLLPIFQILCSDLASRLYRKGIRNAVLCGGVLFGAGFVTAVLLALVMDRSVIPGVVLMAMLAGCMHGVNFILVSMTPPYFRKYGHVSFVSGLLNSCTYLGSAVSTYGIAWISEAFGWNRTVILWAVLAAIGTLLCLAITKQWQRFTGE